MKRTRKEKSKKLLKEATQVIKEQNNTIQVLQRMLENDQLDVSPALLSRYSEQLMNKAHQQIDIPYLRCLLFPELYSADMPQPLCNISYCKFTDKSEGSLTTTAIAGQSAEGLIVWFPQTNHGPSMFVYNGPLATKPATWLTEPDTKTFYGAAQAYDQHFTQTALSAGQISLQYTGQVQQEQGFIVASTITGINPSILTVDDIENGQNRVITTPRDGIRMLYLPKDVNDFSFYNARAAYAHNQGARSGADEESFLVPIKTNPVVLENSQWINGNAPPSEHYPANIKYAGNTEYVAIYWKGLPLAQPLRVDAVRKFNGTPKTNIRDIVEVIKPRRTFDAKKTIDVVNELQLAVPQLAGHTIKHMDRVSDQIQSMLPNIGHLYNEGVLKEGLTLQSLAQQLALNGTEGNGPTTVGGLW